MVTGNSVGQTVEPGWAKLCAKEESISCHGIRETNTARGNIKSII